MDAGTAGRALQSPRSGPPEGNEARGGTQKVVVSGANRRVRAEVPLTKQASPVKETLEMRSWSVTTEIRSSEFLCAPTLRTKATRRLFLALRPTLSCLFLYKRHSVRALCGAVSQRRERCGSLSPMARRRPTDSNKTNTINHHDCHTFHWVHNFPMKTAVDPRLQRQFKAVINHVMSQR